MSIQKLAIGSIVGAVVLFVLGYVLFDLTFLGYYVENAGAAAVGIRESQVYWAIAIGSLGYGALVTCMIGRSEDAATLVGGLKAGALAGGLLWLTADFTIFAYLDLWNLAVTVLDVVLEIVRGAITGAIVALVLGKVSG